MILKRILNIFLFIFKNKYVLTLLVFSIWIIVFDNNNLIDRFDNLSKLNQLEKDKEYYQNKIKEDTRKLEELTPETNGKQKSKEEIEKMKQNLEKFAREEYLMKKPNEDIFIILEKEN